MKFNNKTSEAFDVIIELWIRWCCVNLAQKKAFLNFRYHHSLKFWFGRKIFFEKDNFLKNKETKKGNGKLNQTHSNFPSKNLFIFQIVFFLLSEVMVFTLVCLVTYVKKSVGWFLLKRFYGCPAQEIVNSCKNNKSKFKWVIHAKGSAIHLAWDEANSTRGNETQTWDIQQ